MCTVPWGHIPMTGITCMHAVVARNNAPHMPCRGALLRATCKRPKQDNPVTNPCAPGMKGVITKAYDKVRVCTSTDPAAFSWASGCRARCMDQAS